MKSIDISSLAFVSEGYSAGSIAKTVRTVVTVRRIQTQKLRPIQSRDFVDSLSVQEVTYVDDRLAYVSFLRAVSGLDARRKQIEDAAAGAEGGDAKKKK